MQRSFASLRLGIWLPIIVVAGVLGALIPDYVSVMGDSTAKLMALPAAILLACLVAYSRYSLLLLIVLLRGSTDNLFEESRFAIGGSQIGVGGLLNGFAILIALLLVVEQPKRFSWRLVKTWAPFLAALFLGIVITPDRPEGTRLFLQLLSSAAVFVGAYYFVRDPERFRVALWLVFWSSLVPVAYGFVELATGGGQGYAEGLRLRSTFSHPNILAFYLTIVIATTLYLSRSPLFALPPGKRFVIGLYMVVMLALLMLTKTRSAWVACGAIFFVYALLFERRYFVYLIVAAVAALFIPGVGDRLIDVTQGTSKALSSVDQVNSFAWRQSIWESGLSYMTPSHYVAGYGVEAFRYFAPAFFKEGGGGNWGAHSIYVEIFFELGILGLAAFAWMWAQVWLAIRPLAKVDRLTTFLLLFIGIQYLVTAASDNMLHYLSVNWYLWFVLGAGTAYAGLNATTAPVAMPDREAAFR